MGGSGGYEDVMEADSNIQRGKMVYMEDSNILYGFYLVTGYNPH